MRILIYNNSRFLKLGFRLKTKARKSWPLSSVCGASIKEAPIVGNEKLQLRSRGEVNPWMA